MIRKWLISIIVLILLLAGAGALAIWYVKPEEDLNLNYDPVPIVDRALTMIRHLDTEFVLSEADINNIGKATIRLHPDYSPDIRITGARFELQEDKLVAHVNVMYKKRIPAGLVITYGLRWSEPNVVAVVEEAKLKGITLKKSDFDNMEIPLSSELPKLVHIQKLDVQGKSVVITIRKPTLRELRNLLSQELKKQVGWTD
ncbi:hypothetical protein [Paenibacillus sp. OV219]|uniref:hypothetical protein n=1 Tax=Paenibacillus sp. OV219 TaxID=1884377 RepID=UPI0008B6930E|nr:hypothetical protein [Paenibacillus sp. OV219]SEM88366.1 hypothetical protein SAMN05518847_1011046 [Paenibacillus sp. OV219]